MKDAVLVVLAGVLLTASARAQVVTDSAASLQQNPNAQPTVSSVNPSVPRRSSLSQVVSFRDGKPVARAFVTASSVDSSNPFPIRVTTTDSRGYFTFDSLATGAYDLQIVYSGGRVVKRRVLADKPILGRIVLPASSGEAVWIYSQVFWTLVFVVLYLATIVLARWNNIAKPLHEMLLEQLTALSMRLKTEIDPAGSAKVEELEKTIVKLREEAKNKLRTPLEFLFWSRGRENATWVALHEIERQLAAFLAPAEHVESYLRWAEAELRVINKPAAIAIADAIDGTFKAPGEGGNPARETTRKALLGRGIAVINADRDTAFSTLMEWHNKASWLIVIALLIIAFVTIAAGNAVLFLAGAAGGYLSRLMRALRREDLPLDYGASWTTLWLSPVFGALVGWFGIALITLLAQPELQLLGAAFHLVQWDNATRPATLAVAFLLGFSERFFDAIVGAVERHAKTEEASQRPSGQGSPDLDDDA